MTQEVTQPQHLPVAVMKIVLGSLLDRRRNEAGVTQEQAAQSLGCGQSKIAYIEGGGGIKLAELNVLLDLYQADEADVAYARSLQAESNKRAKRGAFSTRFKQQLRLLVDVEPTCNRLLSHRSTVIPGLLQTEAYMRAQARSWRPSLTSEEIDRDTANRLGRQYVLDHEHQHFWFILDEAVLRRTPLPAKEMKAQITHLAEAIDRPNIEIQLVPFSVGYYMGQGHDYSVFRYETEPPVSVVYLERYNKGEYAESKETKGYLELFDQQKAAAAGQERTRTLLLEFAASL
ncbi:helix-turn-helix domain-containing protein [Amycolatopsis antarctica]|uniref:helix-turn-helix domain-containing protein n=1 Tax=Amycolatopsis antarctica TaxID=1854586 RepID=UPI001F0A5B47|nr:helix-turn-helix transcriptional regulator [Amycolatopsis antarctica]